MYGNMEKSKVKMPCVPNRGKLVPLWTVLSRTSLQYLNLMIYEVYYLNGQIKDYSANYIADNTLNHFYSSVSSPTMTKAVIDY